MDCARRTEVTEQVDLVVSRIAVFRWCASRHSWRRPTTSATWSWPIPAELERQPETFRGYGRPPCPLAREAGLPMPPLARRPSERQLTSMTPRRCQTPWPAGQARRRLRWETSRSSPTSPACRGRGTMRRWEYGLSARALRDSDDW